MSQAATIEYVTSFCPFGFMLSCRCEITNSTEIRCVKCKELLCTPKGTTEKAKIFRIF